MELTRRNVLITFTTLCVAACVVMGFQYPGSMAYEAVNNWIMSQEAGGLRWLSWLFHSQWTEMLVQYVFMIGAAYVPAYLIMGRLPKDTRPVTGLGAGEFFTLLVACMGTGYALNLVGIVLNLMIGSVTGKSLFEMNPVLEMSLDLSPSMVLYSAIVGPVMEEVLFRGMILKRARVFGDRTAVVFTAVMFGLMHGNMAQFLYAAGIGLILGYVAVKTNGIRYAVLLHMMINSYSVVQVGGELLLAGIGSELLLGIYSVLLLLVMFGLIVGAGIIWAKYGLHWYRQLTWHNGAPSPNRRYVYWNPGFLAYFVLCMVDFLAYMM